MLSFDLFEDKSGRLVLDDCAPDGASVVAVIEANDWDDARRLVDRAGDYGYSHVEGYGFFRPVG